MQRLSYATTNIERREANLFAVRRRRATALREADFAYSLQEPVMRLEAVALAASLGRVFVFAIALQTLFATAPRTVVAEEKEKNLPAQEAAGTDEEKSLDLRLSREELAEDLAEFRSHLKKEWILSNLNDADFDGAIDAIAKESPDGMSVAELSIQLRRVLALGCDGHVQIGQFSGALADLEGVRPDFVVDLNGDGYTAYRVEPVAGGTVDPKREYRFAPLKEGYPRLLAIDGVPMADWVAAAKPYVYEGPPIAVRWRALRLVQELPFLRRELKLPNDPVIRVRLASEDGASEIEVEAPTNAYQRWHLAVPRPASRILEGDIGYLRIPNAASGGVEAIVEAMPKLRDTRGLIVDVRDNTGGAGLDALQVMAAYLLPEAEPRCAIGQIVNWSDRRRATNTGEVSRDEEGLSKEGKQVVAAFEDAFEPEWKPPQGRATTARVVFLARAEAEPDLFPYDHERFPKTFAYSAPVVVISNHRCFSAAEIFLVGLREACDATIVGSPTTAAGGGSPGTFRLSNSGLDVLLSRGAFVRADGTLLDGRGVVPDVVVEPHFSDYFGDEDRMLQKAIETIEGKLRSD